MHRHAQTRSRVCTTLNWGAAWRQQPLAFCIRRRHDNGRMTLTGQAAYMAAPKQSGGCKVQRSQGAIAGSRASAETMCCTQPGPVSQPLESCRPARQAGAPSKTCTPTLIHNPYTLRALWRMNSGQKRNRSGSRPSIRRSKRSRCDGGMQYQDLGAPKCR